MTQPFDQLPYADLPATPRVAHPWAEQPMRRVTVDTPALGAVEVAYRELGEGPALLLVHGLMTTGYSWRYVIERLAQHHRVLVPDLPGAGDTRAPAGRRLGAEDVADHLAAFLIAVDADGADVIGNSMGGYLALWLGLRHPQAMRRLVVLHAPSQPLPRLWVLWGAIRLPGARRVLAALVGRDPRRWAHHNVHYWDETLKSVEEASVYGDVLATPVGFDGFVAQLRDMMDVLPLARLGRTLRARRDAGVPFPCPVHLIYARADPMVPPSAGRALHAWVPGAGITWLDEGSHFAHVDASDAFLSAVYRAWSEPEAGA